MILTDMLRKSGGVETTKELRNTVIKFFGLRYSPNKIRATSWRKMIWAGNERSEKCV